MFVLALVLISVQQLERRDPSHDAELEDEDEEMEGVEENGVVSEEEASDSASEDGEDDGEDINDEAPDMELRKKIEEALRVSGVEAATGETDDSDEDEEEDLMDDEQMLAIDEQLAEVFRSRANEKKGGKGMCSASLANHCLTRYQTSMLNEKPHISRIESLT